MYNVGTPTTHISFSNDSLHFNLGFSTSGSAFLGSNRTLYADYVEIKSIETTTTDWIQFHNNSIYHKDSADTQLFGSLI